MNTSSEETEMISNQQSNTMTFIIMGVMAPSISIVGILGNVLCIIVLASPRMRHTNTNKYLLSLSVSDTLVLVSTIMTAVRDMTPDKTMYFPSYATIFCFWLGHALTVLFQVCSVWLTVAFTLDRYLMICHPFHAERLCYSHRLAPTLILVIHLLAILYNLPRFFEFEIQSYSYGLPVVPPIPHENISPDTSFSDTLINETIHGTRNYSLPQTTSPSQSFVSIEMYEAHWVARSDFGSSFAFLQLYHLWSWLVLVVALPLTTIGVANVFLIHAVHRSSQHSSRKSINVGERRRQDTNIMLVGVIIIFLICQIPVAVCHVLFGWNGQPEVGFLFIFNEIANILIIFNSAVNILPYYFFGRKFRQEFLRILCPRMIVTNDMLRKLSLEGYGESHAPQGHLIPLVGTAQPSTNESSINMAATPDNVKRDDRLSVHKEKSCRRERQQRNSQRNGSPYKTT